jgi:hypothetical protein
MQKYSTGTKIRRLVYANLKSIKAFPKDKALECLGKIYHRREHWMAYLQVDPRLDNLRGDPRFEDLVRRVETK